MADGRAKFTEVGWDLVKNDLASPSELDRARVKRKLDPTEHEDSSPNQRKEPTAKLRSSTHAGAHSHSA